MSFVIFILGTVFGYAIALVAMYALRNRWLYDGRKPYIPPAIVEITISENGANHER